MLRGEMRDGNGQEVRMNSERSRGGHDQTVAAVWGEIGYLE